MSTSVNSGRRAAAAGRSPHGVSDVAWAEAVRRETVIRPLCAAEHLGKAAVAAAVRDLGLSAARVYALVRVFRERLVTTALVPAKPGPQRAGGAFIPHRGADRPGDRGRLSQTRTADPEAGVDRGPP